MQSFVEIALHTLSVELRACRVNDENNVYTRCGKNVAAELLEFVWPEFAFLIDNESPLTEDWRCRAACDYLPPHRDDNGSTGHGSTILDGSRRSRIRARDPKTHHYFSGL